MKNTKGIDQLLATKINKKKQFSFTVAFAVNEFPNLIQCYVDTTNLSDCVLVYHQNTITKPITTELLLVYKTFRKHVCAITN